MTLAGLSAAFVQPHIGAREFVHCPRTASLGVPFQARGSGRGERSHADLSDVQVVTFVSRGLEASGDEMSA